MKFQIAPMSVGNVHFNIITMENSSGISVSFMTYGCIITEFKVPDINNNFQNIILRYSDFNDYSSNPLFLGAVTGRTSGKIAGGNFTLNNSKFELDKNCGLDSLNGGFEGFSKKIFEFETIKDKDIIKAVMTYSSPDGEGGYPGNADITITYSLDEENNFSISYEGICDKDTLMNLSNTCYFNLSGVENENILSHELCIPASNFYELDKTFNTTGNILNVENTPFDFRNLKSIGSDIDADYKQLNLCNGFNHCLIFDQSELNPTITLYHKSTKRMLNITTDYNCVLLNSDNIIDSNKIEHHESNLKNRGVCFSFMNPPIGNNQFCLNDSILVEGIPYKKFVNYHFRLM